MPGHWHGSTRHATLPPNWDTELRPAVLERDGYQCTRWEHGARCPEQATDVDHVVPYSQGGTDELGNLTALCGPHHGVKSSIEGNQARWRHSTRRPKEPHPGLLQR